MTLVNFTKKHRRRNGGIRLLGLIDQREVVSATYSELDKGFTELTLDEGASLSKFEFLEDGAEYRETIAAKDGAPTVAHELTFTLERMDADTAAAIEAIIEASRSGLIAVVVTINGDALLLGYSQEFGKEPATDRLGSGHHRPSAVGNHERDGHAQAKTSRRPDRCWTT
ncbi:MAG: hypothetical protein ACLTTP_05280 [Alistipes ihumii]